MSELGLRLAGFAVIAILVFEALAPAMTVAPVQAEMKGKVLSVILKLAEKAIERAGKMIDLAESKNITVPENVTSMLGDAGTVLREAREETNATLAFELAREAMGKAREVMINVGKLMEEAEEKAFKEELTPEKAGEILDKAEEFLDKILNKAEEKGIQLPENFSARIEELRAKISELKDAIESGVNLTEIREDIVSTLKEVKAVHSSVERELERAGTLKVAIERCEGNFDRFKEILEKMNVTGAEEIIGGVNAKLEDAKSLLESGNVSAAARALAEAHKNMNLLARKLHEAAKERSKARAREFTEKMRGFGEAMKKIAELANITNIPLPPEIKERIENYVEAVKEAREEGNIREAVKLLAKAKAEVNRLHLWLRKHMNASKLVNLPVKVRGIVLAINETEGKMLVWGVGVPENVSAVTGNRTGGKMLPLIPVYFGLWEIDYSEAEVEYMGPMAMKPKLGEGSIVHVHGTVTGLNDYGFPIVEADKVVVFPGIHFMPIPLPAHSSHGRHG